MPPSQFNGFPPMTLTLIPSYKYSYLSPTTLFFGLGSEFESNLGPFYIYLPLLFGSTLIPSS
jgi:hypothetical protein